MKIQSYQNSIANLFMCLVISSIVIGWENTAAAQRRPIADETLGSERSVVVPEGDIRGLPGDRIEGGARRGENLFHSFQEFSIDEGRSAYFSDPGVVNILGRVTGDNTSEILGRLGVLGDANLFLINPNGILFGTNASLDIRGSFIGTTADAVRLQNGGFFSASEPETSNLLTVSPSALVFIDQINQPIINRSRFINPTARFPQFTEPSGLQVPANQTLALVSGNLRMDGGVLTATGGRIELGSVNQAGEVRLRQQPQGWALEYGAIQNFGRIRLQEGAVVNAGILGEGNIHVRASRLRLLDGSRISNQPLVGGRPGGNVIINTTDLVELVGIDRRIESRIIPGGLGTSTSGTVGGTPGDVEITTRRFIVRDGASVSAASFNPSLAAGNIRINASESVLLDGTAIVAGQPDRLFLTNLATGGPGVTGSLRIDTRRLTLRNGAALFTSSAGLSGGDLIINASESVLLSGASVPARVDAASEPVQVPTGLFADTLTVETGSEVSPRDSGVTINTARLQIEDGAVISVSFLSPREGRGAGIRINASESVEITGASPNGIQSGIYAQSFAAGRSGDLNIATRELFLGDGGQISVNATGAAPGGVRLQLLQDILQTVLPDLNLDQLVDEFAPPKLRGTGQAGNIQIQAGSATLDAGAITASTPSRDGGSITLEDLDVLLLRRGSTISTEAGTERQGGGGNGGNITLNADFIVALPSENSDINANAFDGSGGNVNINTQGLFGIQPQDAPTELSDITASSEQGIQGTVNINTPDIDPRQGLTELPVAVVDLSNQIAQVCPTPTRITEDINEFIITGRGGLPPSPIDPLIGEESLADWVTVDSPAPPPIASPDPTPLHSTSETPIVEAQGWVVDEQGEVMLVAEVPTTSLPRPDAAIHCP